MDTDGKKISDGFIFMAMFTAIIFDTITAIVGLLLLTAILAPLAIAINFVITLIATLIFFVMFSSSEVVHVRKVLGRIWMGAAFEGIAGVVPFWFISVRLAIKKARALEKKAEKDTLSSSQTVGRRVARRMARATV